MPCRALEAFRLWPLLLRLRLGFCVHLNALSGIGGVQTHLLGRGGAADSRTCVLMPCRALEAFRPSQAGPVRARTSRLNALSGIGGVQTISARRPRGTSDSGLNALSGIGGVQTKRSMVLNRVGGPGACLNALSGIGGVQTKMPPGPRGPTTDEVLMPCRALEAFRRVSGSWYSSFSPAVLMPCRALEAFRLAQCRGGGLGLGEGS